MSISARTRRLGVTLPVTGAHGLSASIANAVGWTDYMLNNGYSRQGIEALAEFGLPPRVDQDSKGRWRRAVRNRLDWLAEQEGES